MTKRTSLRIRPILFSSLAFFLVVLGVSTLLIHPVSGNVELIVNGDFEDDWKGWEKYSLGRGYAALDPAYPHSGQYSLSIQGTATPQSGVVYGSGVNQTVEAAGLPLDLEFSFWVKPSSSGQAAAEMKAVLTLHLMHQTLGPKILKMVYYVAWEGGAESWANVRPDEADYFLHDVRVLAWNYYQGSIRDDFENRWGASTGYSLSKIVLTFQIAVTNVARDTQYVNWDDVSLTAPQTTATTATNGGSVTVASSTTSQQGQNMHLKVGDWWSIKGSYHITATSFGSDYGTYVKDDQYTERFTVTGKDSSGITVSIDMSGTWSSSATGEWEEVNEGPTNSGSYTETSVYLVDLESLNVVNATKENEDWIGYPAWFLVNPGDLREGNTIQKGAWVPNNDAKSSRLELVAWSVGKPQTLQIKGYDATGWGTSYTGQGLGNWYNDYDRIYSKGTVRRIWTFDSIYGIFIGISDSGDYTRDRQGSGWTEKSTDTAQIDDTNLAFSVQTTQTTSQSEYTTSTPGLYTEIWTVASTTTETVATSQDMLNQLGEKLPGGLIGLVGVIAIVVVLLAVTVTRRNRKRAPPPPTPPSETRGPTLPEDT